MGQPIRVWAENILVVVFNPIWSRFTLFSVSRFAFDGLLVVIILLPVVANHRRID